MGDDQAGWMARMDAELGNLRAAIAWLLASGDGTGALRLIVGIEAYIGARPIQAEARRWVEMALHMASDAPAAVRAAALYGLVTRAGRLGDSAAAVAAAEEALALAKTMDDPFALGRAHYGLGMAWTHCEDIARASVAYTRSVPYFRLTDRIDFLASALASLGHAHQLSGNYKSAREALDEALACHRAIDDPTWSTGTLGWRGHLARAEGDQDLAVRLFTESLATAGAVRFESAALEAVVGLAGVALDLGQAARAARLLGAVAARQDVTGASPDVMHDLATRQVMATLHDRMGSDAFTIAFAEGRDIPWTDAVADARMVLERERESPRQHPRARGADLFDLTRREQETLALLCQRLTDPEIAAALYISPRTASGHVANVLGKLGVSSRREAAAVAARHGLV
jgi:non-specific serine/threonine protein kinase